MNNEEPYICLEEDAARIGGWIRERGGIAIWDSLDLSTPGRAWTTPLNQADGTPSPRPHSSAAAEPSRVIRSMDEVMVSRDVERKRFHVAVRRGSQGLPLKCPDASLRRIREEVAKAGEGAWYRFNYATQECIIMRPTVQIPLRRWWNANSYITMDFIRARTIGR